jgi:hypothetical protein
MAMLTFCDLLATFHAIVEQPECGLALPALAIFRRAPRIFFSAK